MKLNRRRMLTLLGVGTASAPLAAKAMADAEVSSLIGANRTGMLALGGMSADGGGPASIGQQMKGVWESPYISSYKYIQAFGLPAFIEENIRERAKNIYAFDPDIAVKKSWSMAAKIHEQRQRNYDRQIEQYSINGKHEMAQSAFQKITGFAWPW